MIQASVSGAAGAAAQAEALNWLADAFWNVPKADLLDRFEADAFIGAGYDARAVEELRQIIESTDGAALHEVAVDHTTMFALGTEGAPLPYESVYSGRDRQLMKPERDEVFALYRENGFVPMADEAREPEDHISHELRFLAHLLEAGRGDAADGFRADHADRWIPLFAREVQDRSGTPFYRAVSQLLL